MRRLRMAATAMIALAMVTGCGDDPADGVDSGARVDAGHGDSGPPEDSGPPVDSGPAMDAGPVDGGAASDAGTPPACDAPIPALARVSISGAERFSAPVFITQPPGSDDLYVVERGGRIRIARAGAILPTPFLDVSSRLGGTPGGEAEWGLLGLAFAPDYVTSGRFFIYFATGLATGDPGGSPESWTGRNVVAEGRRSGTPDVAEPAVTSILEINDFAGNHNGGMMAFGADGFLYVGTGDGGGGGDPGQTAQDLSSLLGKILRLDVSTSGTYSVPATNPFVGTAGASGEIWSYGLRNPWRFSFDRSTGDVWIGDVGQGALEEVDFSAAPGGGENYGWSAFEGTRTFGGDTIRGPSAHHPPIYEFGRTPGVDGASVVGGYVYRGSAIPELRGAYLLGDSYAGFVRALRECDGEITRAAEDVDGLATVVDEIALVSFGEDNAGELYLVYLGGQVMRITTP